MLFAIAAAVGCGSHRGDSGQPRAPETVEGELRQPADKPGAHADADCNDVPDEATLKRLLREAPSKTQAGGLFGGQFEWAATVNRQGELCAVAVSTDDPAASWPGSQAVAIAKAFTANAYSTDKQPLSTARLYTFSQPGHSLFGIAAANPFNPECLATPKHKHPSGMGKVCGGTIAFGGGVPLYRGATRIGGLGVSGDTACADHEIAKTMRELAQLNPLKGRGADDIQYSQADGPSVYTHPLCLNTWRDSQKIGEEAVASGY